MSIGPDIGGDIADAPGHDVISDGDLIYVDLVLDWMEINHGEFVVGDIPFDDQLEALITDEAVREAVAQRVSAAQAEGRAFPLPSARELAAARERALARWQKKS